MNERAIYTEGLTRKFGKKTAVENLGIEVPTGSIFGFLGRNGAGKTTTIRMLMNMIEPSVGRAEGLGLDPQRDDLELRQRVGYVSDHPVMYDWMKIGELVRFTGSFYQNWDGKKVEELLRKFDLDFDLKVKELSRGMNAQLALALAMGHDPELLILDEPTSGLDVLVRRDFMESIIQVIQEEGRTVFLSSHLVHEVERVADQVAIIEGGRLLVWGSVDEIKGRVKKVLVRMEEPAAVPASIDGISGAQGEGAQQLLTVVECSDEKLRQLEDNGAKVLEVIDLSLEESFVELVGARGGVS